MRKEVLTVTQALSEIKMLKTRIEDAIGKGMFISVRTASSAASEEELTERVKSSYQSITDLIERLNAIKAAVVMSNATTTVKVAGKTYTVTEAIDAKKYAMNYWATIARRMADQYNATAKDYAARVQQTEKAALSTVAASAAGTPGITQAELKDLALYKQYIEMNAPQLIDPIGVVKEAERILAEVNDFQLNVDTALSISNATTMIEVVYGKGKLPDEDTEREDENVAADPPIPEPYCAQCEENHG